MKLRIVFFLTFLFCLSSMPSASLAQTASSPAKPDTGRWIMTDSSKTHVTWTFKQKDIHQILVKYSNGHLVVRLSTPFAQWPYSAIEIARTVDGFKSADAFSPREDLKQVPILLLATETPLSRARLHLEDLVATLNKRNDAKKLVIGLRDIINISNKAKDDIIIIIQ